MRSQPIHGWPSGVAGGVWLELSSSATDIVASTLGAAIAMARAPAIAAILAQRGATRNLDMTVPPFGLIDAFDI
jgi:hypothetical protein